MERAGILDAVAKGRRELVTFLDPFHDIDPLLDIFMVSTEVTEDNFVSRYTNICGVDVGDNSESEEWEEENGNVIECNLEDYLDDE